jgi:hypothetical protein
MASEHQDPEARAAADRKADVAGILIIFTALVLAVVYFISGWAPGI